jgi:beta-glucanase (GH16 family)
MPVFRSGIGHPQPARPLTDPAFQWTAGYFWTQPCPGYPSQVPPGWPLPRPAFSSLPAELQTYPNADAIAAMRYSPFSIADAALVITADRTPAKLRAFIPDMFAKDYISGAIISHPFSQTYGYFELVGRVPAGRGVWPAFWLLPADLSWPPEIDAMETLGQEPGTLYTTVHSKRLAKGTMIAHGTHTADLSLADHAYGVDWGPDQIRFYLDRRLVFSVPTPDDCHKPFYLLANLAIGATGSWPGPPDAATVFPARFSIASIRAWQRAAYA